MNLPRFAEVEVRFTVCGLRQSALAGVMVVRPGKGAGFEFLAADARLDEQFRSILERLQTPESAKV